MNRILSITLQYYRLLLFYNILFSGMCYALVGIKPPGHVVRGIIISKFIGFIGAVAYHGYMNRDSFYYYRNTGLSIRRMFIYCFLIDTAFTLLICTIYTLINLWRTN